MADPRSSRTGFVASFSQILGLFLQSSAATLLQTAHSNSTGPKPRLKANAEDTAASNNAVADSIFSVNPAITAPVSVSPVVIDNSPAPAVPDDATSQAAGDVPAWQSSTPAGTADTPVTLGAQSTASGIDASPSAPPSLWGLSAAGFNIPSSTTFTTAVPTTVSDFSTTARSSTTASIQVTGDDVDTDSTSEPAALIGSSAQPSGSASLQPSVLSIAPDHFSQPSILSQTAVHVPSSDDYAQLAEPSIFTLPSESNSNDATNTPGISAAVADSASLSSTSQLTNLIAGPVTPLPPSQHLSSTVKAQTTTGMPAPPNDFAVANTPESVLSTETNTLQASVPPSVLKTPIPSHRLVPGSPKIAGSSAASSGGSGIVAPGQVSSAGIARSASQPAPTLNVKDNAESAGTEIITGAPISESPSTATQPSNGVQSELLHLNPHGAPTSPQSVLTPDTQPDSQNPDADPDKTFAPVWNPRPATAASDLSIPPTVFSNSAAVANSAFTSVPKMAEPEANAASSHAPSAEAVVRQLANEGPELSAGLQAWNGGENLQGDVTQAAQIAAKAGQSEMNIAMQAESLGAVQVRAHVTGDQVGAAITVERRDAHAFLNDDLPALHQALSERQLRLESVSVTQGSPFAGSATADGSGQQHSQSGPQQRSFYSGSAAREQTSNASVHSTFADTADATDTRIAFDSNGRLSVRA
jgi:flagellar hook-length control protein FliK